MPSVRKAVENCILTLSSGLLLVQVGVLCRFLETGSHGSNWILFIVHYSHPVYYSHTV
jgi:hypothetical protein